MRRIIKPAETVLRRMMPFAFLLGTSISAAQDGQAAAAPVAQIDKVEVVASKDPELKPYRQMMDGVDAFEKLQALAPTATLRFILRPRDASSSLTGLSLAIVGSNASIEVPIAADATFALPRNAAAYDDNAELVLNRKSGLFGWRPEVRSTGVPENARRLGDLRLECEVSWAIGRSDISIFLRTLFAAAGGLCHSSKLQVGFEPPAPATGAALVHGSRREALRAAPTKGYPRRLALPVHDRSWPDDALVEYTTAPADAATAAAGVGLDKKVEP